MASQLLPNGSTKLGKLKTLTILKSADLFAITDVYIELPIIRRKALSLQLPIERLYTIHALKCSKMMRRLYRARSTPSAAQAAFDYLRRRSR